MCSTTWRFIRLSDDLPLGGLSGFLTGTSACHSDVEILGSGNVWLYPLNIFPTHPRRALGFAAHGNTRGELF